MNPSVIDLNTKLVVVYYNRGNPKFFMVQVDVTLSGFKDQLGQLNHKNTRRVDGGRC